MRADTLHHRLEDAYRRYHRRDLVHPDPLEFLYGYADPADREIVALIASSLAYGRVRQILRSVANVLDRMAPSPAAFLMGSTFASLRHVLNGFRHRFTTGEDLAGLLIGARCAIERYGSLGACLRCKIAGTPGDLLPALDAFVEEVSPDPPAGRFGLLASPARGSACKRLNLMLRWMVRRDEVDPGGWLGVDPAGLIVPLDTHMFRIGRSLGMIRRRQPDLRAALEMTEAFRRLCPRDPVRYDFALTRLGLREDIASLEHPSNWDARE